MVGWLYVMQLHIGWSPVSSQGGGTVPHCRNWNNAAQRLCVWGGGAGGEGEGRGEAGRQANAPCHVWLAGLHLTSVLLERMSD